MPKSNEMTLVTKVHCVVGWMIQGIVKTWSHGFYFFNFIFNRVVWIISCGGPGELILDAYVSVILKVGLIHVR